LAVLEGFGNVLGSFADILTNTAHAGPGLGSGLPGS
jgi:hypothetical protein